MERFLWGEHQALDDKIGKVDMIIGADVIFWPECIRPLVVFLSLGGVFEIFFREI